VTPLLLRQAALSCIYSMKCSELILRIPVATDALVNPTSTTMTTSPTPASTSVPVSAIIGGAVGGVALLVCIVVFIILWRRIRRIEYQGPIELPPRDFDDSGDKDTSGAPNVEPVVEEQTERYGTARALRYPAEIESGNLRESN